MAINNGNIKTFSSNLTNIKDSLNTSWSGEASLSLSDSLSDSILGLDGVFSSLEVFNTAFGKLEKYKENETEIANYERLILFEEQHPSLASTETYIVNGVSKTRIIYVVDNEKIRRLQAERDILVEENIGLKEEINDLLSSINGESLDIDATPVDFDENSITSYSAVSKDGIKYSVDIIGTPDKNTTVILVNHGGGGSYRQLNDYLSNSGVDKENAIIIRYSRDGKVDQSYKLLDEVSSQYNIPSKNCTTAGFSAGGKYAIKQMAAFVAEHPEIKNPSVFLIDASKASDKVTKEELKALGDSGAVIFSVQREDVDEEAINHSEWHDEYGINFVKIGDYQCRSQSNSHNAVFSGYFNNGILNYQTGEGTFKDLTYTNQKGEIINSYGDFRFYNPEVEGNWESIDITNKTIKETYQEIGLEYRKDTVESLTV